MEERPAFMDDYNPEEYEVPDEIVYASGLKGAINDRFELVLPPKSSIRKLDNALKNDAK